MPTAPSPTLHPLDTPVGENNCGTDPASSQSPSPGSIPLQTTALRQPRGGMVAAAGETQQVTPWPLLGPTARGVRGGMEEPGSRQLPLCSRFASTRQLPGNSIHAAARERQNTSPHPHPRLHGVLSGWHSTGGHGPAHPSSVPPASSVQIPHIPSNIPKKSHSVELLHPLSPRHPGKGSWTWVQVMLLARFSHAERGFS